MATKRSAPYVHPSRHEQVPDEPRRKRQKPNNAGPKSFKKAHPVNELKSHVRSLKRLLEHNDDLPADVRVEKERALQSAQHELGETQKAKKRHDMIGRYHKIRFFDRQKATKRLKRARKELKAHEGDDQVRMNLARAVDDAEVGVNYAQYFPLVQPYVSLFPRKASDQDDRHDKDNGDDRDASMEPKGDEGMWRRVRQCMAEGTLDALRNGELTQDVSKVVDATSNDTLKLKKKKNKKMRERAEDAIFTMNGSSRIEHDRESDDENGDGFFE